MLGNAIVPMVAYQMLRALVRPNAEVSGPNGPHERTT